MLVDELGDFTPRARLVLKFADAEARSATERLIATTHVLLGIIREGEGLGARVLESLDVTEKRVRAALGRSVARERHAGAEEVEYSPSAARLISKAAHDAADMGDRYVGPEHLLLSLISQSDSAAAQILAGLGVSPERVRELIWKAVSPVRDADERDVLLDLEDGLMDGVRPVMAALARDVRAELGRSPDSGDMVVALACIPCGVAQEMLASLGLDVSALVEAAEAARRRGARSGMLPDKNVLATINRLRREQHAAIGRQDVMTAGKLRQQEQEVWKAAEEATAEAQWDLNRTVSGHIGLKL